MQVLPRRPGWRIGANLRFRVPSVMASPAALITVMGLVGSAFLPAPPLAAVPRVPLAPPPLPPLPPLETPTVLPRARPRAGADGPTDARTASGEQLRINGQPQAARWLWEGPEERPTALWLPLEVLQNQLGLASGSRPDGSLLLEWFGARRTVTAEQQRTLADEVAVDAAPLLEQVGVVPRRLGGQLLLTLPAAHLQQVRQGPPGQRQRLVLDLAAPALVRQEGSGLLLGIRADPLQRRQIEALGLRTEDSAQGLQLQAGPDRRIAATTTLAGPWRLVLDLEGAGGGAAAPGSVDENGLRQALGPYLQWQRERRWVGGSPVLINSVRLDPRRAPFALQPLRGRGGMEGLQSLPTLARQDQALVAINGGYFNRIRRLPLGAVRQEGRWLSGPILNRGVVAWNNGDLPRFGRLSLQEWLVDGQGRQTPLRHLNSGYVQRGLSRYTADWGPLYRALSGQESALVLRRGEVVERLESPQLEAGVPLRAGEVLIVARGGTELPWGPGERLELLSRPSSDLGEAPFVLGGGPLLLENGRVVLNGAAEAFGAAFLSQGAPRTVIASDGQQLWLLTLEGAEGSAGPTLPETAALLAELGLRDALNLDGGSSTGLVLAGQQVVKGRGVAGSVNHGLGLVPLAAGRPGLPQ